MIFSCCNTSSLLQCGGGSEIKGCDLFGSFIQKCFVWSFVRSTFLNAWSMYREGLRQGVNVCIAYSFEINQFVTTRMRLFRFHIYRLCYFAMFYIRLIYSQDIWSIILVSLNYHTRNIKNYNGNAQSPWSRIYKNENGRVSWGNNTHLCTHTPGFCQTTSKFPWPACNLCQSKNQI